MTGKTGKIAVFDSGMGGVSFLPLAMKMLPHENFIYYGDLKNAPYGEQTPQFIKNRVSEIFDFFIEQDAKIIVIACNTATSAAVKYLRAKYKDLTILGMEPAIQLAAKNGEKDIVILSTPITSCAPNTLRLIEENRAKAHAVSIPCGGLMDLVENNEGLSQAENKKQLTAYLKQRLKGVIDEDSDCAMILGCTHYIFLRNLLSELYPKVRLYDGNEGTARNLRRHLEEKNLLNPSLEQGSVEFFSSVDNAEFTAKAKSFMARLEY